MWRILVQSHGIGGKMRTYIPEIPQAAVFALTIVGALVGTLTKWKPSPLFAWVAVAVLAGLYILMLITSQPRNRHQFSESTARFTKFFKLWYGRPGRLTIFCTDLDWVGDDIMHALMDKAGRRSDGEQAHLTLLLRHPDGPNATKLRQLGADVQKIRDHIETHHRLSLREYEGNRFLIIRDTERDDGLVSFIETNQRKDPFIVSLARDMIGDCCE